MASAFFHEKAQRDLGCPGCKALGLDIHRAIVRCSLCPHRAKHILFSIVLASLPPRPTLAAIPSSFPHRAAVSMANKPSKWSRCAAAELKHSGAAAPHPTQCSGPDPLRGCSAKSARGERAVREQQRPIPKHTQSLVHTCCFRCRNNLHGLGSHERIPKTFQLQPMQTPW